MSFKSIKNKPLKIRIFYLVAFIAGWLIIARSWYSASDGNEIEKARTFQSLWILSIIICGIACNIFLRRPKSTPE